MPSGRAAAAEAEAVGGRRRDAGVAPRRRGHIAHWSVDDNVGSNTAPVNTQASSSVKVRRPPPTPERRDASGGRYEHEQSVPPPLPSSPKIRPPPPSSVLPVQFQLFTSFRDRRYWRSNRIQADRQLQAGWPADGGVAHLIRFFTAATVAIRPIFCFFRLFGTHESSRFYDGMNGLKRIVCGTGVRQQPAGQPIVSTSRWLPATGEGRVKGRGQ